MCVAGWVYLQNFGGSPSVSFPVTKDRHGSGILRCPAQEPHPALSRAEEGGLCSLFKLGGWVEWPKEETFPQEENSGSNLKSASY